VREIEDGGRAVERESERLKSEEHGAVWIMIIRVSTNATSFIPNNIVAVDAITRESCGK